MLCAAELGETSADRELVELAIKEKSTTGTGL